MTSTQQVIVLGNSDVRTIANGLRVAAERFGENAAEFGNIAKWLRSGQEFPMFASGEPGASAADRLAAQFNTQQADSIRIAEQIEEHADTIHLITEDD